MLAGESAGACFVCVDVAHMNGLFRVAALALHVLVSLCALVVGFLLNALYECICTEHKAWLMSVFL